MITYREFAPAQELAGRVRSYFSFMPEARRRGDRPVMREVVIPRDEPFWTPVFADALASLTLDLGAACHAGKGWIHGTPGGARVIGVQRSVSDETGSARSKMIGVYFEHGASFAFLDVELRLPIRSLCASMASFARRTLLAGSRGRMARARVYTAPRKVETTNKPC